MTGNSDILFEKHPPKQAPKKSTIVKPDHRCAGSLVHWFTGSPVHWFTGALFTGALVHRCTGALVTGAHALVHWGGGGGWGGVVILLQWEISRFVSQHYDIFAGMYQ